MTGGPMNRAVRRLRRALRAGEDAAATDAQLLDRFVARRDEAAFAALVRRHGPMVLGVCRRTAGHAQDAEDAFQATFLVLARKAASLRAPARLAAWLYGVAFRTARKARAAADRLRGRERQVTTMPQPPVEDEVRWQEVSPRIDQELSRLPDRYRIPVLLCDLQGKTRKEAARQLGVPEGTLSSRLAAARRTLARRLGRCGWVVCGGALAGDAVARAAICPWHTATAAVPAVLTSETVRAAALAAAGNLAAAPAAAAALAKGALRAMWMPKLKAAAAVLALAATVGAGGLFYRGTGGSAARAADQPAAPSDADALRKENELLKLNLQAVLEKLRAEEAAKPGDAKADGDETAKRFAPIAGQFKYKVPFETGETYFKQDARIEILEVWGTEPTIMVGGQYLVRGKYVLPSSEHGKLYFYETAALRGPNEDGSWPGMDLQQAEVRKGRGEFTLLRGMEMPGSFHLRLDGEEEVADVYFGTGDNVHRKVPAGH